MSASRRSPTTGKRPTKRVVPGRTTSAKATSAAAGVATYVYCLLHHEGDVPLARAPDGVPRCGHPRAIDLGRSLWIVAADAPLDEYAAEAIDPRLQDLEWVSACAMGHEAVVEHAATLGAIVPMKLFTLFSSDERAKEHVAKVRAAIDRTIQRVKGREEWGVRLRVDEPRALAARAKETKRAGTSGTSFLLAKKREQDAARELLVHARDEADALFADLAKRSDGSKRRPIGQAEATGRVLLDAAFLVPRRDAKTFRSAVEKVQKKLAGRGYDVTLTGPWPPYHFVGGDA